MSELKYFQDYMPGNICFGCGKDHPEGLRIKSYWEDDKAVCIWHSEPKYQGWKGLMHGGILAAIVDCHCMCSALAASYRAEKRAMDTHPQYRFATGTMTIKYTAPTSNDHPVKVVAEVVEIKGKKITLSFKCYSQNTVSAEGEVIAIRVFSSADSGKSIFAN